MNSGPLRRLPRLGELVGELPVEVIVGHPDDRCFFGLSGTLHPHAHVLAAIMHVDAGAIDGEIFSRLIGRAVFRFGIACLDVEVRLNDKLHARLLHDRLGRLSEMKREAGLVHLGYARGVVVVNLKNKIAARRDLVADAIGREGLYVSGCPHLKDVGPNEDLLHVGAFAAGFRRGIVQRLEAAGEIFE